MSRQRKQSRRRQRQSRRQTGGSCGVPRQTGGGCGVPRQTGGSCGVPLQTGGGCGVPLQTGGGWGFDGSTFASAGGAPLEVRSMTNDCVVPVRAAQVGGDCGCNKQRGGSYGVQLPQGGGSYSVDVATNELGKMALYTPGSCQKGGEYPLISTHTASYSMTDPVLLDSGARYLEVQKAGTRRRHRKARRSRRN